MEADACPPMSIWCARLTVSKVLLESTSGPLDRNIGFVAERSWFHDSPSVTNPPCTPMAPGACKICRGCKDLQCLWIWEWFSSHRGDEPLWLKRNELYLWRCQVRWRFRYLMKVLNYKINSCSDGCLSGAPKQITIISCLIVTNGFDSECTPLLYILYISIYIIW